MKQILLALLLLSSFTASAQNPIQDKETLRVKTRLVNLYVNVTDEHGAIVGGLNKEDFTLSEDGEPQKIAIFERDTELPLTMALAIDTSGSVKHDLPEEVHAAKRFTHALLRPIDKMSLYEFQTEVREVVPYTSNRSQIDRGLEDLQMGPATALYDAIYLASQSLSCYNGRKVLVLITDGGNTVKGVSFQTALETAQRADVMIYSLIDVPIEASAGRDLGGEHALITLAEQTGGRYYYVQQEGLANTFAQLSLDLRTQYLLGYYPQRKRQREGYRQISVIANGKPKYQLHYRTGYYADHAAN
jgi:Ca-activated chloride channel family protein